MSTNQLPDTIHIAIKILGQYCDNNIKLLSEKMYRTSPDEFAPLGYLGVNIEIMGIKTFLGYESMAQDIVLSPHGDLIAEDFVLNIIKNK